jgi:hypothetical protein
MPFYFLIIIVNIQDINISLPRIKDEKRLKHPIKI